MNGSIKAKLIVFLIIAVIAFCISSAFATLTIHEDNDSYKMIPLGNDSFEPEKINYVPTQIPKNDTNTTNSTTTNETDHNEDSVDSLNDTIEKLKEDYEDWYDE